MPKTLNRNKIYLYTDTYKNNHYAD